MTAGNVRPIENRGGSRPGAGRKPVSLTDKERRELIRAARRKKKLTKKSVGDILMELAYGEDGSNKKDQLAAVKLYLEYTAGSLSEHRVTKAAGPAIYLPKEDS